MIVGLHTYRVDLRYIGTPFHGWQSQPDGLSVQDIFEAAIHKITGEQVRVTGCSRTDSGVHALQQVLCFRLQKEIDIRRFVFGMHAVLPQEIGIVSVAPVAQDFHPALKAKAKAYRYCLWRSFFRDPFVELMVHRVKPEIHVKKMEEALAYLIGEHDFTSFCAADTSTKSKVRRVVDATIVEKGDLVEIWFLGTGFLKQMVRSMVGTLLDVGIQKYSPEDVKSILTTLDRRKAGPTAPAKGLCLMNVFYDGIPKLSSIINEQPLALPFRQDSHRI